MVINTYNIGCQYGFFIKKYFYDNLVKTSKRIIKINRLIISQLML